MNTVILITADSLRYDYLSYNGPFDETTPFLDSMAQDGVNFENAVSTGSGTSSSFPGILAGVLPLDHGYRGLNRNHRPVAQQLAEQGVRTIGVSGSTHVSSIYSYDRGFERFYEPPVSDDDSNETDWSKEELYDTVKKIPAVSDVGRAFLRRLRFVKRKIQGVDRPYESAAILTDRALEMLRADIEAQSEATRFVWIGYMEPHSPPYPPIEYIQEVHDGEFSRGEVHNLWRRWRHQRQPLWEDDQKSAETPTFSKAELTAIREYYRAQVRYLDDQIERLLGGLDSLGIGEETAVFFTADHGEEFFEHGDLGHRQKVYDELVNVPLIAHSGDEAWESRRFDGPVSLLDLAPTIAEILDVEPATEWKGGSFVDVLFGGDHSRSYAISELSHRGIHEGYGGDVQPEKAIVGVRDADWKYIRNRQRDSSELYDLSRDPGEQENVIDDYPDRREELSSVVEERFQQIEKQNVDDVEISDKVRDQLTQLGYTGE